MLIKCPNELYAIEYTIELPEWAPGIWAGCEGMKFVITNINFETRTITLELDPGETDEKI